MFEMSIGNLDKLPDALINNESPFTQHQNIQFLKQLSKMNEQQPGR